MLLGETILLLRFVGYEELRLAQDYGERSLDYERRVPRFLASLHSCFEHDGQFP